ncbi:hypothetical protein CU254_41740 (plasmid) [Amycolatopsis sp. AA4]|uniref:hypothetical protein n=1 Tax=Actinomycetes TaxID=1760 RepID=UPI0001B57155|nr:MULTISPECIES: hypothetical protein [Actinomycetes]ATY17102.1 hypothetical protein CU254_41740 [Amycolatopsis sp. AA4]
MGEPRPAQGTSRRRLPVRARALLLLTTPALAAGACSGAAPAPEHAALPATTAPAAAQPAAAAEARQICGQFVAAALSVDAAADSGPGDARRRAADRFGIPGLAEQIGGEGRDNGWGLLAAHRARVRVTTEPVDDDPPPVRDDETGAGVTASRVAAGDGWTQNLDPLAAYCSLRRVAGAWKVSGITFSDTGGPGAGG